MYIGITVHCRHAMHNNILYNGYSTYTKPVKTCSNRLVRRHPCLIHTLLHPFNMKPGSLETITPALHVHNQPQLFATEIANSREESKEANQADNPDAKIYTDGSGIGDNAGAVAILYRWGRHTKTLRYCLCPLTDHTVPCMRQKLWESSSHSSSLHGKEA
jgi:hypothetical protein